MAKCFLIREDVRVTTSGVSLVD